MSIFLATVKKENRVTLASTKVRLFNTNRIGELKADGSDAVFKYTRNHWADKESADEITVDETKATIDAFYGGDNYKIILSVLKKKVGGKIVDYADTVTLKLSDIAYGWADPDNSAKSWIDCYPNSFQKVTYQVNAPLAFFDGTENFLTFNFMDAPNSALSADVTGVISYTAGAKAVALTVPSGTTVTALKATFTVTTGATVAVSSTPQVSGTTANNFTNPVAYLVTGVSGRVETYTVTVTVATTTTTTTFGMKEIPKATFIRLISSQKENSYLLKCAIFLAYLLNWL